MRRALALAFGLPLAACAIPYSPDSPEISSRDLDITVEAQNEGTGTVVKIHLGSPLGPVRVTGGDHLSLRTGGAEHALLGTIGDYSVALGDVSGDFTVEMTRSADRAVDATFLVPPSFTLSAPDIDLTGPIALTWTASSFGGYETHLAIEGGCVQTLTRTLPQDTGSYTVSPAELVPKGPVPCPLRATMDRRAAVQGSVFPDLESGYFQADATQTRSVSFGWGP
jgi:hypothetical protein